MRKNSHEITEYQRDGSPVAIDVFFNSDQPNPDLLEHVRDEPEFHSVEDECAAEALPASSPRTSAHSAAKRAAGAPYSIYDALTDFGLLRKVTDIVLAKANVPWHLRDDAAQQVHAAWAALVAKPDFARNQVAHYAYKSGQHAALNLRREIGAVVKIPGALFRTGRDTSFMEAIGAAVNPKDVDDYTDSLDLSVQPEDLAQPPQQVSAEMFKARMAGLVLSKSQRAVAERVLVRRMSADSIALELEVRVSYVERLISQVVQLLNAKDDEALGILAQPRPPVGLASPGETAAPLEVTKNRRSAFK